MPTSVGLTPSLLEGGLADTSYCFMSYIPLMKE